MRKNIVAGNWKMNKTVEEAKTLASGVVQALSDFTGVDVVLCPPFTALAAVGDIVGKSHVALGAQNMNAEASGAFTGEVSPMMLRDVYCHYVVLGHSERRTLFGETDEVVNAKVKAARGAGLKAIVCVGETLEERESGSTEAVIEEQVRGSLKGVEEKDFLECVLAYEPVWAIGTGKTATPEMAQDVHAFIRKLLVELYSQTAADVVRIQYGGSMKPGNAAELMAQPDIDGGLIGGAALDVSSFVDIVKAGK